MKLRCLQGPMRVGSSKGVGVCDSTQPPLREQCNLWSLLTNGAAMTGQMPCMQPAAEGTSTRVRLGTAVGLSTLPIPSPGRSRLLGYLPIGEVQDRDSSLGEGLTPGRVGSTMAAREVSTPRQPAS